MNYREFVAIEFKKRPSTTKPSDYMKKVAEKWRKKKTKTKRGGEIQQMEATPIPVPQPVLMTPTPEVIEDVFNPIEPKGVWLFFHSEDLSPIHLHGGNIKKWFKKVGRKMKETGKKIETGLKRTFKPSKRTDPPLSSISPSEPKVPYITYGKEKRKDGDYDVITISMYYEDNPAIGVGWQFDPKNKSLGYHPDDMEFVSIYYQNNTPIKVFFSQHSVGGGEGVWVDWNKCEKRDGYLIVYVARNSHANYPFNTAHPRVFGLANDVTEDKGPNMKYNFSSMTPSYDWNNGKSIRLYKNLRPAPPDFQMSQKERILRTK